MDAAQSGEPEVKPEEAGSLETTDKEGGLLENTPDSGSSVLGGSQNTPPPTEEKKKGGLKQSLRKFNIYLLLFIFILVIGALIITIAYFQSKKASTSSTLKTQSLTQKTLDQLASSDATVGNPQQVLNVESSAIFAGKVLIREDLEIAGNLQVGGTGALSDLTVSGSTSLSQLSVSKDLSVTGNGAIQGSLSIAKSLQVNGGATFSGSISAPQVTTPSLQLNGDLVLTHHITAGGATPGRSNGSALGGGGTASVSGSDTTGSVGINTGNSPPAGCFITVNFTKSYSSTPHVQITPVGSAAATLDYYVNRTTTGFSVCDATPPPSGSTFIFDYWVAN